MNVRMNGLEKHFEKNMQDMKYITEKLTKKSFNDSGENNQAQKPQYSSNLTHKDTTNNRKAPTLKGVHLKKIDCN